ncbi:hypothetical protein ACFGVS_13700 [Mucilaginibacter sp. AW1-7]|jgi:hypothetical protein|uniref:hypothetical protein n=1 Tax=unclassified Mucilaginibacter TaxID=2617802 RepID=UPI0023671231|nr:hypothetical protein [Mucilaginibacter sp. KACC 22773]WDF79337.1 hypothetical protein PQ469_04885 [Mucilaginibacter sp. KACC 22773]
MPDDSVYHLNLVIDDLTNSIRQLNSGESLETELSLATKEDMKFAIKKNKWHFTWKTEFNEQDRLVYKLTTVDEPDVIQGLISLSDKEGFVYVHLAESAPINFGPDKKHEGVGGNLFAFACKRSWDAGNEGFVSYQAKTDLIRHYEEVLGAVHVGGHNMIIYPQEALFLIKQYFKV